MTTATRNARTPKGASPYDPARPHCAWCGKQWRITYSGKGRPPTMCSPKCAAAARKSTNRHCTVCGNEYNSAWQGTYSPFFCGAECRTKAKVIKARKLRCANANCPTPTAPLEGGRFCSWECVLEYHPLRTGDCRACGQPIPPQPLPLHRLPNYCSQTCRESDNASVIAAATTADASIATSLAAQPQVSQFNEWCAAVPFTHRGARWNHPLPSNNGLPWRYYVKPNPATLPNTILRSINWWSHVLATSAEHFGKDKHSWYAFCVQYGTSTATSAPLGAPHYLESLVACLQYINTPHAATLRTSPVFKNMLRAYYRHVRMSPDKFRRSFDDLATLYYQHIHNGVDLAHATRLKVFKETNGLSLYMLRAHAYVQATKQPALDTWCPHTVAKLRKVQKECDMFRTQYLLDVAQWDTSACPAWAKGLTADNSPGDTRVLAAMDYITAQDRRYIGQGDVPADVLQAM